MKQERGWFIFFAPPYKIPLRGPALNTYFHLYKLKWERIQISHILYFPKPTAFPARCFLVTQKQGEGDKLACFCQSRDWREMLSGSFIIII